jgi:hypothetical protein
VDAARDPNRRAAVSQVVSQRADHRAHGERVEIGAAAPVEAIDPGNERERSDLDEVVELFTSVRESAGEVANEAEVVCDQSVARSGVPSPRRADKSFLLSIRSGFGRYPVVFARDAALLHLDHRVIRPYSSFLFKANANQFVFINFGFRVYLF